jgi:putative transposase
MCWVAGVSRASYYRQRIAREPDEEEMKLRSEIQQIVIESRRRYGSPRVTAELKRRGWVVNHKRVERLMKQDNLLAITKRRFVSTTDSGHNYQVYLNVAARMELTGINQLWVADISYIRLKREFVFFAVVLDRYSRRVVGWALDRSLAAKLPLKALQQAIDSRRPQRGLVHHSDRGIQYACRDYAEVLDQHGILPSMSRPANPYDNAACESFMRTLKREEINANVYADLNDLTVNITTFIDEYYNKKRLHSALGYRSPEEFERSLATPPNSTAPSAVLSFSRHQEIFRPDEPLLKSGEQVIAAPLPIGSDESPAGYSSASCSPAELASASPAVDEYG